MEIAQSVRDIRDVLAGEGCWIQETHARNERGEVVAAEAEDACRWCLSGAMRKVFKESDGNTEEWSKLIDLVNYFVPSVNSPRTFGRIVAFNDHPSTTQADVLNVLDLILNKLEA